jgi:hypothetical protein
MTSQELATRVGEEVDAYEYPRVDGTVGTLWTPERIAGEIALLRAALVEPARRILHIYEHPDRTVWLVAALDKVAVYFDEGRSEFGLGALAIDGSVTDSEVCGDLVGTFMAR